MPGTDSSRPGADTSSREGLPPEARQLLDAWREDPAWPELERRRLWRQVQARLERRPRTRTFALALAAASVLVVLVSGPSSWPWHSSTPSAEVAFRAPPDPALQEETYDGGDRLKVGPGTHYSVDVRAIDGGGIERHVLLTEGELRAEVVHRVAGDRFVVETPHLTVTVVGTRFTVKVEPTRSWVRVEDGRVRVESSGVAVMLSRGEEIDSNDPRFVDAMKPQSSGSSTPRPSGVASSRVSPCVNPGSMRCLKHLAQGTDLEAETALVRLAQRALESRNKKQAVRYWQDYRARFPTGIFAPEVQLSLIEALREQGRVGEASEAAAAFLAQFPQDPRGKDLTGPESF